MLEMNQTGIYGSVMTGCGDNSILRPERWLKTNGRRISVWIFAVAMMLSAQISSAGDWTVPAQKLAGEVVAATGPGAAALEITNRSSLSHAEFDQVSRELRSQMGALGLQFVNADAAAATITISLSEDLQNYVWVAQVRQGAGTSSVAMVSTPRKGSAPVGQDAAVAVHKALVWFQPEQILDAAIMDGSPTHMAVLDTEKVALYRLEGGRWQPEQFLPIPHGRAWPRDARGRLILRKDHLLDAYLPGMFCSTTKASPLGLDCRQSDDPWPLGDDSANLKAFFAPSRNYFTGALAPGVGRETAAPAFYSAAALPRDKYTLWIFAGVDGQFHLLDGVTDQIAPKLDWGSDIASVHSVCGTRWSVLATGSGEGLVDTVRVFDVADREPIAVSQAEKFHGPITALWAEASGNTAIAVAHNSENGNYEAYRLSFLCGQ